MPPSEKGWASMVNWPCPSLIELSAGGGWFGPCADGVGVADSLVFLRGPFFTP
jgi:hypothetical protein